MTVGVRYLHLQYMICDGRLGKGIMLLGEELDADIGTKQANGEG